jgi:hypothetical protein
MLTHFSRSDRLPKTPSLAVLRLIWPTKSQGTVLDQDKNEIISLRVNAPRIFREGSAADSLRLHGSWALVFLQKLPRARELGFEEVLVVDDELGLSAAGQHERPAFAGCL